MTRASAERPTKRLVIGRMGQDFVVELQSHLIVVRPKGCRRGGPAEVVISPSTLYQRLLIARADEQRAERRRSRRTKSRRK